MYDYQDMNANINQHDKHFFFGMVDHTIFYFYFDGIAYLVRVFLRFIYEHQFLIL